MLFASTSLLSEYLETCKALWLLTGGSKCKKTKNKLHFTRRPHIICIVLGILFGQAEIINFVRHKLYGINKSNSFDPKYNTLALILAVGKLIAYVVSGVYLKHFKTQENFFNNLLLLQKRQWKLNGRGKISVKSYIF